MLVNLNWNSNNGIYNPMLQDKARNLFYQKSLSEICENNTVLDLGCGTGILSLMAMEAKARRVIAIENNERRANYAFSFLKKMGCSQNVDVLLEDAENINGYAFDFPEIDVIVTEVFGSCLFEEGITHIVHNLANLPLSEKVQIVPAEIEVLAIPFQAERDEFSKLFSFECEPLSNTGLNKDVEDMLNKDFHGTGALFSQHIAIHDLEKVSTLAPPTSIKKFDLTEIVRSRRIMHLNEFTNLNLSGLNENLGVLLYWKIASGQNQLQTLNPETFSTTSHWGHFAVGIPKFDARSENLHFYLDAKSNNLKVRVQKRS